MAILAHIEVADDGSMVIRNFRDALSDLGVSAAKAQAQVNQSNTSGIGPAKQQADAIQQLLDVHRRTYAEVQKNAQGFGVLTQQLKAGTTVSQAQAAAMTQLGVATQSNTKFTQNHGAAMASLVKQVTAGTQVTPALAAQLQQVAAGHNGATTSTQAHTSAAQGFNVQAAVVAGTLTLLAGNLYSFLRGAAEGAARIETLGVVLSVVGKNAGISKLALQTQIEGVKALGITTKEATDTVLQFVQANLKVADASRIARAAQDLAVVAGENSSATVQRLTRAIQTGETMLLRQVGIVTTNEAIWKEYAATIGKNVNQLDALDKKQAMVNKILTEAGKSAGAYEMSMGTAGKQLTSFARYTEEATLKLGQALTPILSLVISNLTSLFKWFLDLTPATMKWVSAALAAAAAMTTFAAALAGAKFLGIIGMIGDLTTNVVRLTSAVRNGIPLWTAASALFGGPWMLAIVAITVALGAAAAAFVLFNAQADLSTEKETQNAAKAQARIQLLQQTHERITTLGTSTNKTTGEQTLYNQALATLDRIAPDAKRALGELGTNYAGLSLEIGKAIGKQHELTRTIIGSLEVKEREAKAVVDAAAKTADAANKEVLSLQAQIAAAKEGKAAMVSVRDPITGVSRQITVSLVALEQQLKAANAVYGETGPAALAAANAHGQVLSAVEGLRHTLPEFIDSARAAGDALVSDKFLEAGKNIKNLSERVRAAGKDITYLSKAPDVPTFVQRLTEINTAWGVHTKKMEAEGKRATAAGKAFLESLRDNDPIDMAKYTAASTALGEVTKGSEEYARRVEKLRPLLDAYAKSSDPAVKATKGMAEALKSLTSKQYEEAMERGIVANQRFAASLDDKMLDSARGRMSELADMQRAMDEKLHDQRLAQADRVQAFEDEQADAQAKRTLSAVGYQVYQEQQRVVAIERGYAREKLMRDRALDAERAAVDRKATLAQEEVQIFIDKTNRLAELELQLQRNKVGNMAPGLARELAEADLRAAEHTRMLDQVTLQNYKRVESERIETHRVAQHKILDQQAAANKELDAGNQALLVKQKAASAAIIAEILKNGNFTRAAMIDLAKSMTQQFLGGLVEMSNGTKTFKDVVAGLFDTLKQSVMSMINGMVQRWIDGMIQMQGAGVPGGGNGFVQPGTAGGGGGGVPGMGAGTRAGGFLMAGGAGYVAGGIAAQYANGSYSRGILGGAAAGAGAGAAIGAWGGPAAPITAPVGALIGGIMGGIKGWMEVRKQREEMKKNREEIVKDMGGLAEFKRKANEAGFAYDKFLSTKKPSEFGEEVEKLSAALDKLELKKSREEMIEAAGGLAALQRQMALVGFDSDKMLNTENVSEYNAEVERLNKLLEAQQKRLAGLGQAAGGLAAMVKGLGMRLTKEMDAVLKTLGPDATKKVAEAFEKAQKDGFVGSRADWMAKTAREGSKDLDPKVVEAVRAIAKDAQVQFKSLQLVATTTFASVLRETGDINQAFAAVGESLDEIARLQKAWGFEASESFNKLMGLRQVIKDNEDIVVSVAGISAALAGLGIAGRLNSEIMNQMGADLTGQFNALIERGVSAEDAMLVMQPGLQALWEAQKNYGIAVDESTQKLIDQGIEAGVIGDQHQDINQRMLDMLGLIAEALGATLPDSYRKARDAAAGTLDDTGKHVDDVTGKVRNYRGIWDATGTAVDRVNNDNRRNMDDVGRAVDGVEGRVRRARDAWREYGNTAATANTQARPPAGSGPASPPPAPPTPPGGTSTGTGTGTGPAGGNTTNITINNTVTSLDADSAGTVVQDVIVPAIVTALQTNTQQTATRVESALSRVR